MDSWFLKADGESPGIEVTDGESLNIAGGSNVTVTRVSQSITIAATDTTYSVGDGGLTQNNFTNSDHSKLDGIASSANNYTHPSLNHIPTGGSTDQFLKYSSSGTATWAAAPADATKLPLTGGTLSGDLTLTGYRNVSATNSLYLRSNTSTTNITCYGGGATQLHSGGTAILNAGNSSITVYKNIMPSPGGGSGWPGNGLVLGNSSNKWVDVYSNAFSGSSDENMKTAIEDATYGLDFVLGLRPRTFKWIATLDQDTGAARAGIRKHHGFIAQEVEAYLGDDADQMGLWNNGYSPAIPAEVEGDVAQEESSSPNLLYMEFIPILTKAIQELEARLAALEA
jgi:hypothetical protein